MAVRAAVEVGPGREQQRHRIAAAKLDRLLRVGVVDAVFIHPQVAVGPLVGPQRLARHIELPRPVGERLESGRAAKLEQIPDKVAPLLGRQGQGDIRRHERADVAPLLDVGWGDVMAPPRRIDEDDRLRRLLLDDALQHTAVGEGEGIRAVFRLHRPRGPVDRLDDLVRREALGDGRELGADCAPLSCHLVACRAAGRGHVEHARAASRVAVGPRVGEHLRDEFGGPLGSGRGVEGGWAGSGRRRSRCRVSQGETPCPEAGPPLTTSFVRTKHTGMISLRERPSRLVKSGVFPARSWRHRRWQGRP